MTGDLFGPDLPGLTIIDKFVGTAEQANLIARVDSAPLSAFRFQQWTGKRETASYGSSYDFAVSALRDADPFPPWLETLKNRAEGATGLTSGTIVQALLTRYPVGSAIGWHRDRPVFQEIIGISLGCAATLRFRQRRTRSFARHSISIAPGSLYLLAGEARHAWEHSIAPLERPRWSISLRTLA